jgi:hypothetical protein
MSVSSFLLWISVLRFSVLVSISNLQPRSTQMLDPPRRTDPLARQLHQAKAVRTAEPLGPLQAAMIESRFNTVTGE